MGQTPEIREQNGEFTFKKLFWLLKKSGVRMLILCVAAVLLVALIAGSVILATYKDNATAETLVDFNFKGIEDGKDPFGRTFDVSKIKSSNVVSNAISMLKHDGVEIDTKYQNDIIDNLSVEGIIPDDIMQQILIINSIAEKDVSQLARLNDLTYFPSRYKLTISNLKKCGLDKKTAPALLNKIVASYVEYFKETYSEDNILATIAPSINLEEYDFVDMYDVFSSRIATILMYLENKAQNAPNFRSSETSLSFNDLINSVELLRDLDVAIFENNITNNGITNNPESIVKTLEAKKVRLENQISSTAALIEALNRAIREYSNGATYVPGENGAQGTFVSTPSAKYDELFTRLVNAETTGTNLRKELADLEERIEKFKINLDPANTVTDEQTIAKNKALAVKQSESISEKLNDLIVSINLTTDEYLETEAFSDSISTAVPAVYQLNLSTSIKIILLAAVIAVIAAAIVAVLLTYRSLVNRKEWEAFNG